MTEQTKEAGGEVTASLSTVLFTVTLFPSGAVSCLRVLCNLKRIISTRGEEPVISFWLLSFQSMRWTRIISETNQQSEWKMIHLSAWPRPPLIKGSASAPFLTPISRTRVQGRREPRGTLMVSSCAAQGKAPTPAHLRALWWNNSKCLSCIVWHAAGGALKPLLPAPKAPLNKIVKNNSFTLILPSDYCTPGGKLAAIPCASAAFSTPLHLHLKKPSSLSSSSSPSIPPLFFRFPVASFPWRSVWRTRWTLWDKCDGGVCLLGRLFYGVNIRSNMWLIGGCIFHSLMLVSEETPP